MNLEEILTKISGMDSPNVIVTGAQRSGTRIAAKIIAQETGLKYIDENDIEIDNLYLFFKAYIEEDDFVLHAPGLSHIIHELPQDCLFIWMRRPEKEIIDSIKRVNWDG